MDGQADVDEETNQELRKIRARELERINDPTQFPALASLSPAFFLRRVLVYTGPKARLEFITVPMPEDRRQGMEIVAHVGQWNWQWEAGPYRAFDTDKLPPALTFLRDLETLDAPDSDIVLVPCERDNIYELWAPLYHLLPRRTLEHFDLPLIGRGVWPLRGVATWQEVLRPSQRESLEVAFAQHLWSHGLGRLKSPLIAFSKDDPLKLLSHDLPYWRSHMELLLREHHSYLDRVKHESDDPDPASVPTRHPHMTYEMPRKGMEVWSGEVEAAEMTRDLIDIADERGRLRAVMDAIRSHRVEEDFSKRWSGEREDFERKLYRKRNKVKVSFVEFDDSIPYFDGEAELDGNVLYRGLMSVVDPKDRHVIVCLHNGITGVGDIAEKLGYANHSPVSKALARIRKKAAKWLE
jgi:hypothetical protein